jgi:hypothetical protein
VTQEQDELIRGSACSSENSGKSRSLNKVILRSKRFVFFVFRNFPKTFENTHNFFI